MQLGCSYGERTENSACTRHFRPLHTGHEILLCYPYTVKMLMGFTGEAAKRLLQPDLQNREVVLEARTAVEHPTASGTRLYMGIFMPHPRGGAGVPSPCRPPFPVRDPMR